MRYLVRARLKPDKKETLLKKVRDGSLGEGSVAEGEYKRVMKKARLLPGDEIRWVEVCYCDTPLEEELPYWEEFFEIVSIRDAHPRKNCRDYNGTEPWACGDCDCTESLDRNLSRQGLPFLETIREEAGVTRGG